MFGLEDQQKKGKNNEFVFELEKELKDSAQRKATKAHIEERVQKIKELLRSGENKEEFDKFGVLLHGYTALLKVVGRFTPSA